jgi:hypothetical protein
MIRGPLSRRTVVVPWLLNWLCLRYGVAKPSVWLRRKACKPCQFNGFASDYPLTLAGFGFQNLSVLENWDVLTFRALRSEGSRSVAKLSQSWSQSPGNVAGFCHGLSSVDISRKALPLVVSRSPAWNALPFRTCWMVPLSKTSSARCCARLLAEPAAHVLVEPEQQVCVCSRSARSVGATDHKSTRTERNSSWIRVEAQ